jgi:sugar phosphate isomerase/epimerase
VRIGVSLPPAYLAGEPNELLTGALGDPATALAALRRAGVTAIELRAVGPHTDPALALAAARQVWHAEATLTIHGELPASPPAALYPALVALCREMAQQGQCAIITVHSYKSLEEPTDALAARTIRAVRELLHNAGKEGLPLRLAVELSRSKGRNDPSTTYRRLLSMHAQIAHPHVGFCWDFGHAFSNVRQGVMRLVPPDAFLRRVIHTHIHDLDADGATHAPLTEGRVALASMLSALRSVGYGGILNLELNSRRQDGPAGVCAGLFASIARLVDVLTMLKHAPS